MQAGYRKLSKAKCQMQVQCLNRLRCLQQNPRLFQNRLLSKKLPEKVTKEGAIMSVRTFSGLCFGPASVFETSVARRSLDAFEESDQSRQGRFDSTGHVSASHPQTSSSSRPCLLVALRPTNLQQEKERFFQSGFKYEPQFEYEEAELTAVWRSTKRDRIYSYNRRWGLWSVRSHLPKSQVWAAVRKYLQKEGCVGEVVVRLSDELLSQAVMVIENCRPTLTINLAGARQFWLEGMLRHEIGTHYLRGVNNSLQPWSSSEHRKALGLKGANPTEEGLASLHSVLLRKQPFLWRAALLYYTVHHAASMSFTQLFHHIEKFVSNPDVRWEYCLRAKRGQTDTAKPGCFSKDQVYLDGILKILRHRRSIDFQLLTALGKVSFEDVERLRSLAVLSRTRIPHFMSDPEKYLSHLDHIMSVNELSDAELERLLP
ncbi:hypothetical protein WMY93_020934 [Mugilogobius chulae]|uniref:KIAA0895-like n=1 Tax=Mugilogobius chulae TaxID=88201 RepID=A0AAW0NJA4_9GOBI